MKIEDLRKHLTERLETQTTVVMEIEQVMTMIDVCDLANGIATKRDPSGPMDYPHNFEKNWYALQDALKRLEETK
jgi:aspartyl-tRNA synthetase